MLKDKVRVVRCVDVWCIHGSCAPAREYSGDTVCVKRLRHDEADVGEGTFARDHSGLPRRRGRVRRDSFTI